MPAFLWAQAIPFGPFGTGDIFCRNHFLWSFVVVVAIEPGVMEYRSIGVLQGFFLPTEVAASRKQLRNGPEPAYCKKNCRPSTARACDTKVGAR